MGQGFTPEVLDALQQLIAHNNPDAVASGYVPPERTAAPAAAPQDPAAAYKAQAQQYGDKANTLEAEAAKPYPQPKSTREHVVSALRAGMENFGRLGAPGGYYGQEEQRQKDFTDANNRRVEQVRALRGEAAQQEQLGQQASFQTGELANQERNAKTNEDTLAHNIEVSNRPVRVQEPQGGRSEAVDPRTQHPMPGTEVKGTAKEQSLNNYQRDTFILDGKKDAPIDAFVDVDPSSPTQQHIFYRGEDVTSRVSHYEKPAAAPANGGNQIVQGKVGPDGQPSYIRVPVAGPAGPVTVNGETVQPKPAEAPQQIKNQADSAHVTQKMATVVRNLVAQNPNAVGPAVGRINELALRLGGDPGGFLAAITGAPIGDGPSATLSGHLAYLFLNEARATMPGRPAKEYMDVVKSRSAQMSQNPAILEGFLQSAENNAKIIKATAALVGYDLDALEARANNNQNGTTTSSAPAVGGTFNGHNILKVERVQ